MTYGDMKLSALGLKLTIKDIELLPSKSNILWSFIISIFPSANVERVENYIDYPESKISVRKLSIKIRVSSLAGPTQDGDPSHTHEIYIFIINDVPRFILFLRV